MTELLENFLYLPISIGCFVFLIQQTDFIYEYSSLFSRILRLKFIDSFLKLEYYEKNSANFENYVVFIGSVFGAKKNLTGFISRLISCFICLSCFLSLISVLAIYNSLYFFLPCFFIAAIVFYILFSIKKKIYE